MTTYFITGVNRGIGFQIFKQLASDPANKVIGTIRDKSRSSEVIEIAAKNPQAFVVTLDIGDVKSIDALDAQLSEITESIDVYIANAGIAGDDALAKVVETSDEVWTRHFNVNTFGNVFTFKRVFKYLKKGTDKKVVFVSSLAGSIGGSFSISFSAYGSSKAALNYTAHNLSFELGPEGYTVFPVHPGVVLTEMGKASAEALESLEPAAVETLKSLSITPADSASQLIDLIKKADSSYNGRFWNYDGQEVKY